MGYSLIEKIIKEHSLKKINEIIPGEEIQIKVDQTLTQDATATLAYLEFLSIGIKDIKTKLSVSYIDHNLPVTSRENSNDQMFLESIAKKYGIVFSPRGNGICHQLHLDYFFVPGEVLIGSDSHTPTCGAAGMLGIAAGGLEVACVMAGYPYSLKMPKIVEVRLHGTLNKNVEAKDVILELLRRYKCNGGVGKAFEYTGEIKGLNVYQRAVITNMGTELGLTTSIFPSDEVTHKFMVNRGRGKFWKRLFPDDDARYHEKIDVNLSNIEPLIACPHSPDNVKSVRELEGLKVDQVCIGSCTNSSYQDMITVISILKDKKINKNVEMIIAPGSKEVLHWLFKTGFYGVLLERGVRILEPGCGPCIGVSCIPFDGAVSLRTFNRNFKGRCGNENANIYLCSTSTAVISAINGEITDPRKISSRSVFYSVTPNKMEMFIKPKPERDGKIFFAETIKPLPKFKPVEENISACVLLKLKDNISTDDIIPANVQTLRYRSNITKLSEYTFSKLRSNFFETAKSHHGGIVLAGNNYGQGSSREHAALVLRYLGIKLVIAKSFARIHLANLINFGIIPLRLTHPQQYDEINEGDKLTVKSVYKNLKLGKFKIYNLTKKCFIDVASDLTAREIEIIKTGSLLNYVKCLSQYATR